MSERFTVAIVDDEPLARDAIRLLLERQSDMVVVGEASGFDAAALVARTSPDLMFLDIQMPEVDGFEVLRRIGVDTLPAVIFVTAYDRYALRAFEVHALDYLLKPLDEVRFRSALDRARERIVSRRGGSRSQGLEDLLNALRRRPARFLIRKGEKSIVVEEGEIDWIEAANYYVSIHTGKQSHLLRETMIEIEARLDPSRFVRVHRSTIVNLDRVREVHPLFRGDCTIVLEDGTRLRLSRGRKAAFESRFATARHRP